MERDGNRPADFAIVFSRMMRELMRLIWETAYRKHRDRPGAAVDLYMVSMQSAIATREGKPMTATEIGKMVMQPRSTVQRLLEELERTGRVRRVRYRWHHDLDALDDIIGQRAVIEEAMGHMEACLTEWRRLYAMLGDQLKEKSPALAGLVLLDGLRELIVIST